MCTEVHICLHRHTDTYGLKNTHIKTCTHSTHVLCVIQCIHTDTHRPVYTETSSHMQTRVHRYTSMCMYTACVHKLMSISIHRNIHTYSWIHNETHARRHTEAYTYIYTHTFENLLPFAFGIEQNFLQIKEKSWTGCFIKREGYKGKKSRK